MKIRRANKYSAISCKCMQGHIHQSGLEASYCTDLTLLKKAKGIKDFDIQVRFDLKVKGKKICEHYVDFLVTNNGGKKEVHETKGFATAVWNLKRKLFEALYPKIPYIVVTKFKRWK